MGCNWLGPSWKPEKLGIVLNIDALTSRMASGTLVYRHMPRYTPMSMKTTIFVGSRNGRRKRMRTHSFSGISRENRTP